MCSIALKTPRAPHQVWHVLLITASIKRTSSAARGLRMDRPPSLTTHSARSQSCSKGGRVWGGASGNVLAWLHGKICGENAGRITPCMQSWQRV